MAYLVCDKPDSTEGVKYYTIVGLPGNPQVPYDPALNEYGIYYDVSQVPDGSYNIMVSACNDLYCSLPAPFLFEKRVPNSPSGLMVVS